MNFSKQDMKTIIEDETKSIDHDLVWRDDEDHSPAKEFRAAIHSNAGYPLDIRGYYSPNTGKLSYALICRGVGRLYALDLGAEHLNPTGERVGKKHKHRWSDRFEDGCAYVPEDITAPWHQPVRVWQQFCTEARICHNGKLMVPQEQLELPL